MRITFLGTSGMVPTKERNVQGIHMEFKGQGILLDCGEGTQRQLSIANINPQKITTILISHWHGDHVSGLIGLIQTLGNFSEGKKKILLFGPEGTKHHLNHLMNSCLFETQLEVDVNEVDAPELTTIYEKSSYRIDAVNLDHSVPCLGYRFVRAEYRKMDENALQRHNIAPGPVIGRLQQGKTVMVNKQEVTPDMVSWRMPERYISFIFDTKLCQACYDLAQDSRLLISEAVYTHDLEEKANQYKHMTAQQAAQVASEAGVEQLILTHFSQRYKDLDPLLSDAKELFENVTCAYDLMNVNIDL